MSEMQTPWEMEREDNEKLRARIAELEAVVRELRRPIICSIFGIPREEIERLVGVIDGVLGG